MSWDIGEAPVALQWPTEVHAGDSFGETKEAVASVREWRSGQEHP